MLLAKLMATEISATTADSTNIQLEQRLTTTVTPTPTPPTPTAPATPKQKLAQPSVFAQALEVATTTAQASATTLREKPFISYIQNMRQLCAHVLPANSQLLAKMQKESVDLFLSVANQKQGKHRNKKKTLDALTVACIYTVSKQYKEALRTVKEILTLSRKSLSTTDQEFAVQRKQFTHALKLIQQHGDVETCTPTTQEPRASSPPSLQPPSAVNSKFIHSSPTSSSPASSRSPSPDGINVLSTPQCNVVDQKRDFAQRTCSTFYAESNKELKKLLLEYGVVSISTAQQVVTQELEQLSTKTLHKTLEISNLFPSRVARTVTATAIYIVLHQYLVNMKSAPFILTHNLLDLSTRACDVNILSVKTLLRQLGH